VFFGFDDPNRALANVQWVYLAIACFVLLLAVVFFFAKVRPALMLRSLKDGWFAAL